VGKALLVIAVVLLIVVVGYVYLRSRYGAAFSLAEFLADPIKNIQGWFS